MTIKLSAISRGAFRGMLWAIVLGVILSISAYSLYFVARHLGVPRLFAAGMSTAYDGTALIAAGKSLQYAQEGRSGASPRFVMVVFAGLSAWLNALHSVLGNESPLAIPMWAGLPIAAAAVFELHTSQARAKAMARLGKKYPAPLPSWGGITWALFPLRTLNELRDYVSARSTALVSAQETVHEERRERPRRPIPAGRTNERPGGTGERTAGTGERTEPNERTERTGERTAEGTNERSRTGERTAAERTVVPFGRAAHAPERHIREWARSKGYPVGVRGAIPAWIKDEYANERSERDGTNDD